MAYPFQKPIDIPTPMAKPAVHRRTRIIGNVLALLLLLTVGLPVGGCGERPEKATSAEPAIPHGYMARLEIEHDGTLLRFGPFVGYYFRPVSPDDLSRLRFICFNEDQFYASDMPAGAKLFEGAAVMVTLPEAGAGIPRESRINPIFFEEAPDPWLASRPDPKDEYRHFHSCHNARGAVRTGYWLRHAAAADFTYDMGGRVGPESPLFHRVEKGPDLRFARIIEFDHGPGHRHEGG